ncbi:MAG: VWA domain-containing protein [Acidobacteria bacterium]|nr:VWA domain-containing protein [Acidobacteriota bacterium]
MSKPVAIGLLAAIFFAATANLLAQTPAPFVRDFPEGIGVLTVQNLDGRTEVESWSQPGVRVLAETVQGGAVDSTAIALDTGAPGVLSIRINAPDVHLRIFVPAQATVSVRGGKQEVTIRGTFARLTVETDSGPIVAHSPAGLNADVTLESKQGNIFCALHLQVAGASDLHHLAGKIGRGGAPIKLQSASGQVVLFQSDAAPVTATPTDVVPPLSSPAPTSNSPTRVVTRRPIPRPGVRLTSRTGASGASKSSTGNSGDAEARLTVTSNLVLLNTYVTDASAKSIADLKKEDFSIVDKGKDQEIAVFEPVQRPLDLFLLLDLSGSTKSKFDLIKKASKRFLEVLAPDDRVAIAAFTSRFMLVSDFTSDRKLLNSRIDGMKNRGGGTAFYRAMWDTLELLHDVDSPRRAIVVMTDGVDNALQSSEDADSVPNFEELYERARAESVSVFPIYLNTEYEQVVKKHDGDSMQYKAAREQLAALAEASGTTVIRAERLEDLAGAYELVAAQLRNLYTIGFYPSEKGGENEWRPLKVQVKRNGATARARVGYYSR